jgi:peptidoglycan/xylan/chitin deacetylase (PgdA/CDA1 family)
MSRVVVLMYHIVAEPLAAPEARYCCAPRRFEAQMRHLHESGVPLVGLERLADAFDGHAAWPGRGVAVTFDDGFADTFANALPVLARYRIPATMFAVADRIGTTNDWMVARGYPPRRLMSGSELREMAAAGVAIGSHTRTHPRLPEIGADIRHEEIRGSKERLEQLLGGGVAVFAYPYGLFDDASRQAVEEAGYRIACSTRSGFNGPDVDRYLLRRVEVYGGDNLWQFRQKIKFGANEVSNFYPLRYYAGRISSRLGF